TINAAYVTRRFNPASLRAGTALYARSDSKMKAGLYGLLVAAGLSIVQPCAGVPFTFGNTGSLATARSDPPATWLSTGKVLVVGGLTGGCLSSAELYDPANGTWTATGSLGTARELHTATLLSNGKVLVAGGYGSSGFLSSAELYDPASGTWTTTGSLGTARDAHTATLLPNGKVLAAG